MNAIAFSRPQPIRRARLVDVARAAGVAPNTASTILNRRPNSWASDETKQRVFDAAKSLGYRPSRSALGLRLGTFYKISLIVPDLSDPNTAVCAHLLAAPIRKLGYHTEIDESGHDPATEDRICQRLTERESDGAIIMTRRAVLDASLLAASSASGPRVLVAFRKVPDFAGDQVVMSAAPALQDMLDALAAAGHRRIALLGGGLEKDPVAEDLAALVRARSGRSGFKLIETPGKEDPLTLWSALPARKRPTALLATTDADAMRCLTRTRATGLEVPRDFSLVTLEGGRLASFAQMSLAGVAMPCERICDQAAMLLLKRINGHPDAPPECVIVPSRFRTGSSLDQAPVD